MTISDTKLHDAVKGLNIKELRAQLRGRGMSPGGSEDELRQRLKDFMSQSNSTSLLKYEVPGSAQAGLQNPDHLKNNYARPSGNQNLGNRISDRASSRVLAPPGGKSQIVFGDGPAEPPVRPSTQSTGRAVDASDLYSRIQSMGMPSQEEQGDEGGYGGQGYGGAVPYSPAGAGGYGGPAGGGGYGAAPPYSPGGDSGYGGAYSAAAPYAQAPPPEGYGGGGGGAASYRQAPPPEGYGGGGAEPYGAVAPRPPTEHNHQKLSQLSFGDYQLPSSAVRPPSRGPPPPSTPPPLMNDIELDTLFRGQQVKDLRIQCRARGLSPAGAADVLKDRVKDDMKATGNFTVYPS